MKKIVLLLLAIMIVLTASTYIFISNNVKIAKVALINANQRIAYRCLTEADLLHQVLKEAQSTSSNDSMFFLKSNDIDFQFKQRMFDVIEVLIIDKSLKLKSFISLIEISPDSAAVEWKTEMKMSTNPFKRIKQYFHAKKIHESMSFILAQLQKFVSNRENVYGLNIERGMVTDSLLVTTRITTNRLPSHLKYYALIKKLQDYIADNGASPANYPMLNITAIDSDKFQTTVAVPINKILPDNRDIVFKRMFPGKILSTEIKGGEYAVETGFKELSNYISDNQLTSPAIPFQSLVTNRVMEPDTSKWITKLYYPIY